MATLLEAAGKSNDALGVGEVEREQVKSWLTRIGAGEFETEAGRKVSLVSEFVRRFNETSRSSLDLFNFCTDYLAMSI